MFKSILEDAGMLQYFHAAMNKVFFNNELKPALIRIEPPELTEDGDIEEVEAATYSLYDPCLIVMFHSEDEDSLVRISLGNEIYTLTVLLHEMVHQYNAQKGLEDVDETGHTKVFFDEAAKHGLVSGYRLTEEAKETIQGLLFTVQSAAGIREQYRR